MTRLAGAPVVRMRGAAADVGHRRIWSGLDLDVHAGDFVAVLGPNGAGKTTLLRMILGLVAPAVGSVTVLGGLPRAARPRVAYLPQRRTFEAKVRIRGVDLVRLGVDGNRWGIPRPSHTRAARARVDRVLEVVGAGAYARRAIGECSGGEQQRLLIAQALVREPALLLLDEPLESLDLPNQQAIAALVSDIARTGVAVVVVAHDVNPIMRHLDGVVYIARGRALAGPPSAVITTETLTRLYGAPVDVLHTSDGRLVVAGQPDAASFHADH
jgi:zinc/manganese transport system ATP-binding protein